MKKVIVLILTVILVTGFGILVYFGLKHSRGVPVVIEKTKRQILKVPYIEKEIDLKKGILFDFWNKIPDVEIKLLHQVTALPWPKSVVPNISVKTFHNKKDIYFYLSWDDETEDWTVGTNKFPDAGAVMFPLGDKPHPSTLLMGFMGKSNTWQWKASQDREYWLKKVTEKKAYVDFYYPFEEKEIFPVAKVIPKSAVNDLVSIRVGTITPKETQDVHGRGFWDKGTWNIVIRRSLKHADSEFDAVFNLDKKRLCAFAVWNGSKGDRGGRKSISDWVELEFEK